MRDISSLIVDIFLKVLLHIIDDSSELLPEDTTNQGSSHVETLLTVVISIILSGSTKLGLDKSIGHVPTEESFLKEIVIVQAHMR